MTMTTDTATTMVTTTKMRLNGLVMQTGRALKTWALSLVVFLGGCSLAELGYNNAPSIVHTWLVNQVELYDEQSIQLEQELELLLDWHRQHELPRVKQQLRVIQSKAPRLETVTAADIEMLSLEFRESLYRTAFEGAPRLAALMVKLWPNQISQVRTVFDESNDEYREDKLRISEEAAREESHERMASRFETWLGDLNAAQLELIDQWSRTHTRTSQARYERRLNSQSRFMGWVELAANRAVTKEALSQALTEWLAQEQGEVLPTLQTYREQTTQLVVSVLRNSTPEQKQHLADFTAEWLEILEELISA